MNNSGPHYEPGRYVGVVTDQGLTKASTGTIQLVLKIRITEGTQPARDVEQYERTLFLAITDKTLPYLVPKLQALGYNRDSFAYLDKTNPQHQDLAGTKAEFFCKHEPGKDGDLRERWDVCSPSALDLKPPDVADVRKLDALFGKQLKALKAAAPKPAVTPKLAASEPPAVNWGADDDAPF